MPVFTVQRGRRYRATIRLGLVQSFASNEAVAEKFEEAGFTEVEVFGPKSPGDRPLASSRRRRRNP